LTDLDNNVLVLQHSWELSIDTGIGYA